VNRFYISWDDISCVFHLYKIKKSNLKNELVIFPGKVFDGIGDISREVNWDNNWIPSYNIPTNSNQKFTFYILILIIRKLSQFVESSPFFGQFF
jgi:hypothetical protein